MVRVEFKKNQSSINQSINQRGKRKMGPQICFSDDAFMFTTGTTVISLGALPLIEDRFLPVWAQGVSDWRPKCMCVDSNT